MGFKTWLVQSSSLRKTEDDIEHLLTGLKEAGVKWVDFGVPLGTSELTNWKSFPYESAYFMHCSIKVLRLLTGELKATAADIFPNADEADAQELLGRCLGGIFYDKQAFSMHNYLHVPHLLNPKPKVTILSLLLDAGPMSKPLFIKPSSDLKLFAGTILPAYTPFRQHMDTRMHFDVYSHGMNEKVLICDLVEGIDAEWRFFIVDGHVVTGSQYMPNDSDVPADVLLQAQEWAKLYQPARCFVMDLARVKNELKIVEYNCINCSGLYRSNISQLATALANLELS